jgi:predicted RNA-binding protein YlxR (DUF448 family)
MKKVPVRSCLICRERSDKRRLFRIVKNKEGEVFFDKTLKANGRGAYVCDNDECIEKIKTTNKLDKAFEIEIGKEIKTKIYDQIREFKNIKEGNVDGDNKSS